MNSLISSLNQSLIESNTTIEILSNRLTAIDGRLGELAGIIVESEELIAAKETLIENT